MKALVIGYGSIGQRHINNLLSYQNIDVIVCTKRKNVQNLKKKCTVYDTIEKGIQEKPDFAIICNETSYHVKTAIKLAKNNIHLFIEKPLSNSTNNVDNLLSIIKQNHLITLVGCNLRFHKCIQKIKEIISKNDLGKIISVQVESGSYLPEWHQNEDYRNSYASKKNLGGGVIFTCIHELDYLHWFFGNVKEIFSMSGKFSDLDISVEDLSAMLMRFNNNIIAEVHLDYFQRPDFRKCKIIGTKGTLYWNSNTNTVEFYDPKKKKWIEKLQIKDYDRNTMYVEELSHFIDCLKNKHNTINPVANAIKVLDVAMAAKKSSHTKKVITI